jgi:hypothetical protein
MALENPSGKNGCFFDEKIVFTFYKNGMMKFPMYGKIKNVPNHPPVSHVNEGLNGEIHL